MWSFWNMIYLDKASIHYQHFVWTLSQIIIFLSFRHMQWTMHSLTAQVTSSLLPFPRVTVEALREDEITLNSVLHGRFTVGKPWRDFGRFWIKVKVKMYINILIYSRHVNRLCGIVPLSGYVVCINCLSVVLMVHLYHLTGLHYLFVYLWLEETVM